MWVGGFTAWASPEDKIRFPKHPSPGFKRFPQAFKRIPLKLLDLSSK